MKKSLVLLVMLSMAAFAFTSCQDKGVEGRIAKLEKRIEALEQRNGITSNNAAVPPSSGTSLASLNKPQLVQEEPKGPFASIDFEKTSYNFGEQSEGAIVEHTFSFTNNGEAPLVITNASSTCGCTVPKWPKEPIPVGGTGKIEVRFDTKGKAGQQNKVVTLTANTSPNTTTVNLTGSVIKANKPQGPLAQ